MPLIATGKAKSDPIPEGEHFAICYAVHDLGTHISKQYGNASQQIRISFELPELRIQVDGKDFPRSTGAQFSLSLGKKSRLRPMLESWRGKKFTEAELEGFDLGKLVGIPCRLMIVHEHKDGNTYSNIQTIIPAPKGTKSPMVTENKSLYYSISDHGPNIPEGTPEFIIAKIKESQEFKGGFKPSREPGEEDLTPPDDFLAN